MRALLGLPALAALLGSGASDDFSCTSDLDVHPVTPAEALLQTGRVKSKSTSIHTEKAIERCGEEVTVTCEFSMEMEEHLREGSEEEDLVAFGMCVTQDGRQHFIYPDSMAMSLSIATYKLTLVSAMPPPHAVGPKMPWNRHKPAAQMYKIVASEQVESFEEIVAKRRAAHPVSLLQNIRAPLVQKRMTVLMIRAIYSDAGERAVPSETEIWNSLYSLEGSMRDFIAHASYEQLLCEPEDGKIVTVDMNSSWSSAENEACDDLEIGQRVYQKVREQHPGLDPEDYTYREIFIPTWAASNCPWGGKVLRVGACHFYRIPNPGGCQAMYRFSEQLARIHELGHNLGLYHAGGQYYGQRQPVKGTAWREGGDPQAAMSGLYVLSTFAAPSLEQQGFISESNEQVKTWTPETATVFTLISIISPLDRKQPGEYIGIKFPCDDCIPKVSPWADWITGGYIWISFRGDESNSRIKEGVSSEFQGKVFVHYARSVRVREFGHGTELWAELTAGQSAQVYEMPYAVHVCSIDLNSPTKDIAKITVGANASAAEAQCLTTLTTTAAVTTSAIATTIAAATTRAAATTFSAPGRGRGFAAATTVAATTKIASTTTIITTTTTTATTFAATTTVAAATKIATTMVAASTTTRTSATTTPTFTTSITSTTFTTSTTATIMAAEPEIGAPVTLTATPTAAATTIAATTTYAGATTAAATTASLAATTDAAATTSAPAPLSPASTSSAYEDLELVGSLATFDEAGYQSVAATCCNLAMEKFIRRLILSLGLELCNEYGLVGLLPWYTCEQGVQSFAALSKNILASTPPEPCAFVALPGACMPLGPVCKGEVVPNTHRRRQCSTSTT